MNRSGRGSNNVRLGRGRGLLETPYLSPWQQGPGFEDYMNSTYASYMKGVQKAEEVRSKLGKINRTQIFSSRTRHQQYGSNQSNRITSPNNNMHMGKSRGQHSTNPNVPTFDHRGYGRGSWLSP